MTIISFLVDKEQHSKLLQAEKLLNEIGVKFDTGTDVSCGSMTRQWFLDWSLKGPVMIDDLETTQDRKDETSMLKFDKETPSKEELDDRAKTIKGQKINECRF